MPERIPQLARTGTMIPVGELLGCGIDFAANGNREEAAGGEPIDHAAIEPGVPEQVAEHEVDRFAGGEAGIQVEDVEAAPAGQSGELSQLPTQLDGDRRHVHAPVRHPSTRQPHCTPAAPTRDLQRPASRRKEMIDLGERRKRGRHPEDRRHAPGAVPAIPVLPMSLAHGSNGRYHGPSGAQLQEAGSVVDRLVVEPVEGGGSADGIHAHHAADEAARNLGGEVATVDLGQNLERAVTALVAERNAIGTQRRIAGLDPKYDVAS